MSDELPTSTDADQTGRLGVSILQECLEREGWIFRRQRGDSDYGMDGEIEIVDKNKVTGRIVKCQVKSSEHVEFRDGETSVSVRVSTYNLWRATPLITVLFHVGTASPGIYWTPALAHHPRPGARSLSVRFEEASDLRQGLDTLRAYLNSWFAARGGDAMLREMPLFHPMYQQLTEDVDGYDDWTDLGEDDDGKFRLLYQHVLRLRLEAGLSNEGVPSLDDWYVRDAGLWNGGPELSRATFSEAMKLIGPAYEEALNKITSRLASAELTPEGQALWNFIGKQQDPHHVPTMIVDDRADDPEFHRALEKKLRAVGALKYEFERKRR
jgi:hypothetical protein